MGNKGCLHIAEALKTNSSLTEINISCCGIASDGIEGLRDALMLNSNLQSLDLSDNSLLTKGIGFLSEGLAVNNGVENINLTNTGIGVKGGETLSKSLKENYSLHTLILGSNQIKKHGATMFAELFAVNNTLKNVDLSFNQISALGIKALLTALNKDFDAEAADAISGPKNMQEELVMKNFSEIFAVEEDEESLRIRREKTTRERKNKLINLDLKLTGNIYSRAEGEVSSAQVMVPPKMARSKLNFEHATKEKLDVPMWQIGATTDVAESVNKKNVKRRGSFSLVAPEAFDDEAFTEGKNFILSEGYIKELKKSSSEGVFDKAEPVERPRWREEMKLGRTLGVGGEGAWDHAFAHEKVESEKEGKKKPINWDDPV